MPQKNKTDQPIQYIKGWVEFYKLKFKVTPDVLIPRPETELLVDQILKIKPNTVLEVGTGSGNVAIAAVKNLPNLKVTATEVSGKALKVAKQNAKFHGVDKQIEFIECDLIEGVKERPEVMVANLPYIPTERINYLDSSVKDFEPYVALDGGEDGFELYRKLFLQMIKKNIYPNYFLAEIDYTHGLTAILEAQKYFPKCKADVHLDLAHKQRFLVIEF